MSPSRALICLILAPVMLLSAPAHADNISVTLGAGDAFSVRSTGPIERLRVDDTGTVSAGGTLGLGTTTPLSRLDVRGDIRFGSTGNVRAAGGQESLRIVRGVVLSNGSVAEGSGFTASRIAVGYYRITFSTAFADIPAVTVIAQGSSDATFGYLPFGSVATSVDVALAGLICGCERDEVFQFIAIGPR